MALKAAASESAPATLGVASGSAVYVSRRACKQLLTVLLRMPHARERERSARDDAMRKLLRRNKRHRGRTCWCRPTCRRRCSPPAPGTPACCRTPPGRWGLRGSGDNVPERCERRSHDATKAACEPFSEGRPLWMWTATIGEPCRRPATLSVTRVCARAGADGVMTMHQDDAPSL